MKKNVSVQRLPVLKVYVEEIIIWRKITYKLDCKEFIIVAVFMLIISC